MGLRDGDCYSVFLLFPIWIKRRDWPQTRGKSGSRDNMFGYSGSAIVPLLLPSVYSFAHQV